MYKFVEFFRHMTFVFLQLGEVLFVDLRLKMMVASVEVKESIKSLDLMQDKQHETTALLVNILPLFYQSSHHSVFRKCLPCSMVHNPSAKN